jgi:hypothetical protein
MPEARGEDSRTREQRTTAQVLAFAIVLLVGFGRDERTEL